MFFWWICGGESVLPILLLCHLSSSSNNYPFYIYKVCSSSFSFQILLTCTTSFLFIFLLFFLPLFYLLVLIEVHELYWYFSETALFFIDFFPIVSLVSISLNSALISIVSTACLFFFKFLEVGTWITDLRFSLHPKACCCCC